MNEKIFPRAMVRILIGVALIVMADSATADSTRIAGQFQVSYAKQEALPVPAAEGHVLMLGQAEGTNSSSKGPYMDGAEVVNREILRLFNGNGTHEGYLTFSKDGSEVVDKWNGKVTTTMNKDGTPNTTFEGTWEKLSGTGKYEGIKGSGTYKGYFTSQTDYVVEYTGYYYLP